MSDPTSSDDIPTGKPVSAEQQAVRAFMRELETKQLDFLDQAGKRIIELGSALLALLFGILAFGDSFPPAYLTSSADLKLLLLGALAFYMLAMGLGAWGIHPQSYANYPRNLTAARAELAAMVRFKATRVQAGGICFMVATLLLAMATGILVWAA